MKKNSKNKLKKRLRKARKQALRKDASRVKARRVDGSRPLEAEPVLAQTEQEMAISLEGYDETSLARAKTHWFFGEWEQLAALDLEALATHPDRDRFALLAASAHQQLGDHDKARKYVRMALDWGCPNRVVAQVLIAGVHNSLGRAAALKQDESRTACHFEASVAAIGNSDSALVSHARSVREISRIGLLPQAVTFVEDISTKEKDPRRRPSHKAAHMRVQEIEMDWLRESVLTLRRKQFEKDRASGTLRGYPTSSKTGANISEHHEKYYGLDGLDRKLEAYLDYDCGYYVELGANDGISQSNTLYFERERKWHGILIEPVLHNFLKCKANRSSENRFASAACVSFDYEKSYVNLSYSNLMTTPTDLESDIQNPTNHAHVGELFLPDDESVVDVLAQAKTLTEILDENLAPRTIDLLSLDVEGAEIEVLKGIDLKKYKFLYMLVESRSPAKISAYLEPYGYTLADQLSHHDYLFCNNSIMTKNRN